MEVLIILVLIGMVVYLLPYIIAAAMIGLAIIGGLLGLLFVGISKIYKKF